MKALITAALAVTIAIAGAAPATIAVAGAAPDQAADREYLQRLQDQLSFLSAQQLLAEGHKVCDVINQGVGSSNVVVTVSKDLGISLSAATYVVSAAVAEFHC
jgi:Protein of unknown function (DUF732)